MLERRPLALIILDGFGHSESQEGNAIALAYTPFLDQCFLRYPHTLLEGSGKRVGLPEPLMGNSEIGHLNIGAGRIVPLDVTRIDEAIASGTFFENPVLQTAIDAGRHTALHLVGLVSDGGVHSSLSHLVALLEMAARRGVSRVFVHCITDGRDTAPAVARNYISQLLKAFERLKVGRIATVCGRYFAMDRDNRWDRIEKAYRAMVYGEGRRASDALLAVKQSYELGVTDEFIDPIVIIDDTGEPAGRVRSSDSVIFFNYRADRARQLTRAFSGRNFDGFRRDPLKELNFAAFTQYDRSFTTPIVFPPISISNTLAEVFAANQIRNLRVAETEKYAHVTYFFNGGIEPEFEFESRTLIPSPPVATYDLQPEMSAYEVAAAVTDALDENKNDVYIVNFANADMVGHTGNLEATVAAVEAIDECLAQVVGRIEALKGAVIITSDHGNAEQMIDPVTRQPSTAHTNNPVPFMICDADYSGNLRPNGALEDIAPTMLAMLGLEKPPEMTGRTLLVRGE